MATKGVWGVGYRVRGQVQGLRAGANGTGELIIDYRLFVVCYFGEGVRTKFRIYRQQIIDNQ